MTVDAHNVSVVICAYTMDRWHDLAASVESALGQTSPPGEVIVVIDYNPTLLEQARRELCNVIVVENNEAHGLGGARNSGMSAARGEVVAFLDDDAIASPVWLEQLCAGYQDEVVVGVGGATEPMYASGRPSWFPEEFGWVVGCDYRGMPEGMAPVRNLFGCNMSFRRDVLMAVGGFQLGYGCDETELCIRLRNQLPGSVLLYAPQARIQHRVPPSRARWSYFLSRCYFEGGSKANVARLVGPKDALASERAYTFRTLPLGVMRGLADTVLSRDPYGLARAGAITAGLLATTAGYVRGRVLTAVGVPQRTAAS